MVLAFGSIICYQHWGRILDGAGTRAIRSVYGLGISVDRRIDIGIHPAIRGAGENILHRRVAWGQSDTGDRHPHRVKQSSSFVHWSFVGHSLPFVLSGIATFLSNVLSASSEPTGLRPRTTNLVATGFYFRTWVGSHHLLEACGITRNLPIFSFC